jgi:hypothetical protein
MRCRSCDKILKSPEETSRKSVATGEYLDLCNHCMSSIGDTVRTTTRLSNRSRKMGLAHDPIPGETYVEEE